MNQRKKRTSNSPPRRSSDPHYAREAGRYEHPVASREFILETLTERGVPVTEEELERLLRVVPQDRDAFAKRLAAMQRDGEIMRNRRNAICVVAKLDLVRGRVQGHADGFGFLVRDEGGPDLFLGPKEMRGVLHGDRAMARISGMDRRGRPEGQIVEVLERGHLRLVGRLRSEHGILFVTAEDKRISHEFLVPPDAAGGAKTGPGGDGGNRRAAFQARPAGCARRRGARQLRRSRHGDRDRAEEARAAPRFFARSGAVVRENPQTK